MDYHTTYSKTQLYLYNLIKEEWSVYTVYTLLQNVLINYYNIDYKLFCKLFSKNIIDAAAKGSVEDIIQICQTTEGKIELNKRDEVMKITKTKA